jgi:hypothetical protein
MLCNIKQSKAEAKVNIIHSLMKAKRGFSSGELRLAAPNSGGTHRNFFLTRVNKKNSGACICIELSITQKKKKKGKRKKNQLWQFSPRWGMKKAKDLAQQ